MPTTRDSCQWRPLVNHHQPRSAAWRWKSDRPQESSPLLLAAGSLPGASCCCPGLHLLLPSWQRHSPRWHPRPKQSHWRSRSRPQRAETRQRCARRIEAAYAAPAGRRHRRWAQKPRRATHAWRAMRRGDESTIETASCTMATILEPNHQNESL